MIEIRLKECCLECECPRIQVIADMKRYCNESNALKGKETVFCDSEMSCKKMSECQSGYIKNA